MRRWPQIWLLLAVSFCVPAGAQAQNTNNATGAGSGQSAGAVVPKPVRKPDQVITNDSIGLLAVRRAPRILPSAAATQLAAPDDGAVADAATNKTDEMAFFEKQVLDKQKRIALLMKLFVQDEQAFLKNPSGPSDPATEERRRYEQDELRWETAELAKVRARLDELKSKDRK